MKGILFIIILFIGFDLVSQDREIRISKSKILILEDSVFAPTNDTIIYIPNHVKYKIKNNPYRTSKTLYEKVDEFSNGKKYTGRLLDLIFVEKEAPAETAKEKDDFYSSGSFEVYNGFLIRDIKVKHVDIFEGNARDTSLTSFTTISKIANKFHVNTWNSVIRNSLIIRKGDVVDPNIMADAERIIRQFRFIEDAKIYIRPINKSEVEVILAVKDRMSWGAEFELRSIDSYRTDFFNRNILGSGKYAAVSWYYKPMNENPHGVEFNVGGQNIDRSITNWNINYTDRSDRKAVVVNLQKEFISPLTKWGGGIQLGTTKDSIYSLDGERSITAYNALDFQDLWFGRSFALKQNRGNRKNVIVTTRILKNEFDDRPIVKPDSNFLFYNRIFSLSEISFTSQDYFKSNYIVSFGITEDIPIGFRFSALYGRDFNEFGELNYFGLKGYWSRHYRGLGYISLNTGIGIFQKYDGTQSVLKASTEYFSPLLLMGRYYVRNFLRVLYTHGNNQPTYKNISLDDFVADIEGDNIAGSGVLAGNIESVLFTPWYIYGFRFAPFAHYYLSDVWDDRGGFRSYSYHSLGGGIRIKNESLVFNTFEFRATHFLAAPEGMSPTQYSIRFLSRIRFDNMFQYKPTIIAFR